MANKDEQKSREEEMDTKNERGKARFEEFTGAITSLARKVLEDVGDEQFKRILCESVNAHNAPGQVKPLKDHKMKEIRGLLIETPLPHIKKDIEEGFEDVNINEKFQSLLEMQDKYRNRETKAWRPPSDPHQHMAALRVAEKRRVLDQYEILVAMKRRLVDQLKDQFKENASCDFSLARTELDEIHRKLEVIQGLNDKFNEINERVVDQVSHEIEVLDSQPTV